MAARFEHEASGGADGDLAAGRTRAGEPIGALAARCTPAEQLDPETYERLLTVLDRLP
jgi:hypothetical protein